MKKTIHSQRISFGTAVMCALLFVVLSAQNALAQQWTTSGTNIYNANTGNVGIGTTAPSNRFNVQGGTNTFPSTSGSTSTDTFFRITNSTGGPTGGALDFGQNGVAGSWLQSRNAGDYTSNFPLLLNPNGGKVGIGMTTPTYKLELSEDNTSQINVFVHAATAKTGSSGRAVGIALGDSTNVRSQIGLVDNASFGGSGNDLLLRAAGGIGLAGGNTGLGVTNQLYLNSSGNVGIGTSNPANKLHVAGSITVDGNINAKYQDVAEWVPSSDKLSAGTVVVLDAIKPNQVISSTVSYDTRVAGVVSEKPGIALGESGNGKLLVATTGRVRVKVDASSSPIHIGDLLVTSGIPGVAMKSEPVSIGGVQLHRPGTLIGKALEPLGKGSGEILVLLSLQ
jgi:hypothetical protein